MNKNIHGYISEATFKEYAKNLYVYLKASNNNTTQYDPYRNVGYIETYQSPLTVKAIVTAVTGNSLVAREIGLAHTGSIYAFVKKADAELIKIASKIEYNNDFYCAYIKAVGKNALEFPLDFGFVKIQLFKKGLQNG